MFLTIFYMVATWLQSWRLMSLKTRLSAMLQGPQATRPTVMFYDASKPFSKKGTEGNRTKNIIDIGFHKDLLSSSLCTNKTSATLGDLLWYQEEKRLCTIFPQQEVDVSTWLTYPHGKSIFPLFAHNYGQVALQDNFRMHVLIEADLETFNPIASTKATKLEDYGTIVTWTSDENFAVILETDLDHITKFTISLMHGQCFINNGLLVTRVESVIAFGKPCISNLDHHSVLDSKKLIGKAQWNMYVQKLRTIGFTAKLVVQRGEPIQIKECAGVIISPGSKPLVLEVPTILEMLPPNDILEEMEKRDENSSVPSTPPPTPASASAVINGTSPKHVQILQQSMELSPSISFDSSTMSSSNLNLYKLRNINFEEDSGINLTGTSNSRDNLTEQLIEENVDSSSIPSSKTKSTASAPSFVQSEKRQFTMPNKDSKPPNILIYADSTVALENIRNVLYTTLDEDKYVIYALSMEEAKSDTWMDQAVLVVVYGNTGGEVTSQLVEYILRGGKLLALCSDVLNILLPSFKTAEVRESELVSFSYGKWKHVRMLHHIFCYQASPVKTKFHEDSKCKIKCRTPAPRTPEKTSVTDRKGKMHTFDVKVLGAEETWQTPSILLAQVPAGGGKAIFSQIHLEVDPLQYEFEENKFNALKQSNTARLEIFRDLLNTHLGIQVTTTTRLPVVYSSAFFLGRHELKLDMLRKLKDILQPDNILKMPKMEIQFCEKNMKTRSASATFLPVMVHQCPENFSTVEYFENLKSKEIGRLVIYTDIITSTMDAVAGYQLHHGLVVISRQQCRGQGRNRNTWLSPQGCAMFTLQLHIPLNSPLGSHVSLIQLLSSVSVVDAIRSLPGYENIDITVKWPNDIYMGNLIKIGGNIVTSMVQSSLVVCNIGLGVNLSNSSPTTCINDVIDKYNKANGTSLQTFSYERFLALIFTSIENWYNIVQNGNIEKFYEIYYKYWIHNNATVTVVLKDGTSQEVLILGIDGYGFLQVQGSDGNVFTVHPDGNSFDILKGLIAPNN